VRDDTRFADRRRDVSDAAHDPVAPTTAPIRSMLSTPFWNGMTCAPRFDERPDRGRCASVSHSLTAKSTSRRSRARRIVDERRLRDVDVTVAPAHGEPALAHAPRCRPRATNATSCPACAEPRAEVAADAAGTHHRDAHDA
jgi:hypothetical protein